MSEKLLATAKLLYAQVEGCVVNHHGIDFEEQGLPGWLIDCKSDIEAAESALSTKLQEPEISADNPPESSQTCHTCQGNGEIVTDWDRHLHAHEGDKGDETVAECPDCVGMGWVEPTATPTLAHQPVTAGWTPTHRHVKRGSEYKHIGTGRIQSDTPLKDMDYVEIYLGREGDLWARKQSEFHDGRFATLKSEGSMTEPDILAGIDRLANGGLRK